jgi:hypothetical protein
VICPHCGELTGVAPDPTMNADEAGALVATDRQQALRSDHRNHQGIADRAHVKAEAMAQLAESPIIVGIVGAAQAVGAAVGAVVDTLHDARDESELPTAIAHVHRRHVTPVTGTEPEPTEPPAQGEEPRFLK